MATTSTPLVGTSKAPPPPTSFRILSLSSSMRYHWAYHWTLSLHLNHMIFLNAYLFSVFLVAASSGYWQVPAALAAAYGLYVVVLAGRWVGAPYVVLVGLLASGAWLLRLALAGDFDVGEAGSGAGEGAGVKLEPWQILLVGVGAMLGSFICQLVGHARTERLIAKPHLFHGFVAAPALEWVSFLYRCGAIRPPFLNEVWGEVAIIQKDAARRAAETKAGGSKMGGAKAKTKASILKRADHAATGERALEDTGANQEHAQQHAQQHEEALRFIPVPHTAVEEESTIRGEVATLREEIAAVGDDLAGIIDEQTHRL